MRLVLQTVHEMYIEVFSNHHTFISMAGQESRIDELIAMLKEKHPNIEIHNDRILSEEEYFNMLEIFYDRKNEEG